MCDLRSRPAFIKTQAFQTGSGRRTFHAFGGFHTPDTADKEMIPI